MEIIIGILLINAFVTLFGLLKGYKINRSYFGCGLIGYNGESAPDADKLKILWMYNLGRGDDSCGIYWDGLLKKGVGTKANVFNFLEATTLKPITKYNTVIGHTRKSTVGSHTENNAHPFGFYTKANYKEAEKVELKNVVPYAVGAHNGIIRNRPELRKKYGTKYDYDVDSMEILNILIDSKTEPEKIKVLEDYEGYAALMWTFSGTNELFIFRGKSAIGEDSTGERPLFYWKKRGVKAVYISSIKESLMTICDEDDKDAAIKSFEPNKIYSILDGQISTLKLVINREGKGAVAASSSGSTQTATPKHSSPSITKVPKDVFIGFPARILKKMEKHTRRDTNGTFLVVDEPYYNPFGNDKVVFTKGRYFKNGHILGQKLKEGVSYILDDDGYAPSNKRYNKETSKKYYFWNGWLVKSEENLKWLCDQFAKGKLTHLVNSKLQWINEAPFKEKFSPNTLIFDDERLGGWTSIGGGLNTCYSGKFVPLFNQNKEYAFNNGYLVSVNILKEDNGENDTKIADDVSEETEFIEVGTTDSDVEIVNNYLTVMEIVKEAGEAIVTQEGEVTESLRQKLVKWLDAAYFYLNEHIEKEADKEEAPADSNALIY